MREPKSVSGGSKCQALERTGLRRPEAACKLKPSARLMRTLCVFCQAKSNQPLAAVLDAVAGGLPLQDSCMSRQSTVCPPSFLQEQMCYEWLRMLRHDKPAHSALMIVEAGPHG